MKIKQLNFSTFDNYKELSKHNVIFIKPFGCKLLRLYNIPDELKDDNEFIEVLNTLCKRLHKGVYYFRTATIEDVMDIQETLRFMNIEATAVTISEEYYN